jgi:hypothetical protein
MKMLANPTQVSQPIVWNLRTDAVAATKKVARNPHQTLQAACVDSALMPIETPRIPDPVQRT